MIALRVVVSGNKHDCYVAQRAVQQLFRTLPERSKDFIRDIKKANGYQSLHETVLIKSIEEEEEALLPVEVQIRTSKMHYIAEYGFAAHWKYKESGGGSETEVRDGCGDGRGTEVRLGYISLGPVSVINYCIHADPSFRSDPFKFTP